MGLLGAIDGFARSNKPSLSEREAVLLFFPGQGIFTRWAGRKFSLGNVSVMTMTPMTVGVFISRYSSNSSTVALRAACAPMTSTWAMSAVFDGPLMNVP